ncbi:quaternary ammonium compound-resistance protein SugE, partial [Salmonella enterica subsp. enterica serovar Heidelberg]
MNKKVEIHFLPGKNAISHISFAGRPANASFTGDGSIDLEPDMPWIVLLIAGLFAVVWALGLKYTHGATPLT